MAMDLGTLVAKVRVDDDDFTKKSDGWSTKGAAIGSAFGNLAANGISQAIGYVSSFIGEAVEASDATDKFRQGLEFAGLDTGTIDRLTESTRAYADETVFGLTDIMSVTAALASNGVKDYDSLAMAMGNLTAVNGGGAEAFSRIGSMLTQTAGAGKLTTENWNQLTDAIPGASGALQEALLQAGAYTGNFREAMEKGEITADEFNAAIMELGNDPIAVEAAKSTETFEGAIGNLNAAITGVLMDALTALKPAITDVINGISDAIGWLKDNPEVVQAFAIAVGVLTAAIIAANIAMWAMSMNPIVLLITAIVVGVGLLIAAIWLLVANWDTVWAWVTQVFEGFVGWITGLVDGFIGWWNGVWSAVGQWISDVWSGFTGFVSDVWNGFINFLVSVLVGYISFWIGAWNTVSQAVSDVWNAIVSWVTSVVSGFVGWLSSVWNGFVSFWSGLWSGVQSTVENVWNGIVSFFEGIPDTILGFFEGAGEWLLDVGENIIQGLIDGINNMVGAVGDAIGGVLDWAAGFFPHSPAKRGPLSGAGWYAIGAAGEAIVAAFAEGLQDDAAITAELNKMMTVPSTGGWNSADMDSSVSGGNTRNITVQMFEPQHPDTEEALYHALGSPRVRD